MEREWHDRERRYREDEARRFEIQRQREIDDRRWALFQKRAEDWEERARLLAFIAEVQRRLEIEGEAQAGDLTLRGWIAWAQQRVDELDPFSQGLPGVFAVQIGRAA